MAWLTWEKKSMERAVSWSYWNTMAMLECAGRRATSIQHAWISQEGEQHSRQKQRETQINSWHFLMKKKKSSPTLPQVQTQNPLKSSTDMSAIGGNWRVNEHIKVENNASIHYESCVWLLRCLSNLSSPSSLQKMLKRLFPGWRCLQTRAHRAELQKGWGTHSAPQSWGKTAGSHSSLIKEIKGNLEYLGGCWNPSKL